MRYDGTRATLFGEFTTERSKIEIYDHLTNTRERVRIPTTDDTGHGGGDFGVVAGFARALRGDDGAAALTSARVSLESHLLAFAAEESRHENIVIEMAEFRKR